MWPLRFNRILDKENIFSKENILNTPAERNRPGTMPPEKLKSTLAIAYALYLFSLVIPLCLIAGVIWAYLKRHEAAGTAYYNHFSYLIKTFWYALLLPVAGSLLIWFAMGLEYEMSASITATVLAILGMLLIMFCSVWFIYRSIAGWVKLNNGQSVSPDGWR